MRNKKLETKLKEIEEIDNSAALSDIVGLGDKTKDRLIAAGITTDSKLRSTSIGQLSKIVGNPISIRQIELYLSK